MNKKVMMTLLIAGFALVAAAEEGDGNVTPTTKPQAKYSFFSVAVSTTDDAYKEAETDRLADRTTAYFERSLKTAPSHARRWYQARAYNAPSPTRLTSTTLCATFIKVWRKPSPLTHNSRPRPQQPCSVWLAWLWQHSTTRAAPLSRTPYTMHAKTTRNR